MPRAASLSFASALDASFDPVLIVATAADRFVPRIVTFNEAFARQYGVSERNCGGKPLATLRPSDPGDQRARILGSAWRGGTTREGSSRRRLPGGTRIAIRYRARLLERRGSELFLILVERDLSEREHERRGRDTLRQVLNVQRQVLGRGLDLDTIRQQIVNVAQVVSGADAAVLLEHLGEELAASAAAGESADTLLRLRVSQSDSKAGNCCRTGKVLRYQPDSSGRAILLIPLWHGGRCHGVLELVAASAQRLDEPREKVLYLASSALAVALDEAHKLAEERSRRRLLVDALPILISYVDQQQHYRETNAAYARWFGSEAARRMQGRSMREGLGEAAYERIRSYIEAALAGERVSFEAVIPYRGKTRPVEADYIPHRTASGQVEGFFAVVRNIEDRKRAATDYLTGAMSRFRFEEVLEELYLEASRYGQALSLIIIDIDRFKRVNDRYGHSAGDQVLKAVAKLILGSARDADLVGRWGGEEFVVVAPHSTETEAAQLAERIRCAIARRVLETVGRVTASFGVAQLRHEERPEQLFERADAALYAAKNSGRNRVMVASELERQAL